MAIMAVTENGVVSSEQHFETTDLDRSSNGEKIVSKDQNLGLKTMSNNGVSVGGGDHERNGVVEEVVEEKDEVKSVKSNGVRVSNVKDGVVEETVEEKAKKNDESYVLSENGKIEKKNFDGEGFKKEIRVLEESLSKLNPLAKEFVPPSLSSYGSFNGFGYPKNFVIQPNVAPIINGSNGRRNGQKRNNFPNGKKKMNSRTSMAQREEVIRRTVYVSDIDQQVTEEQLASLFQNCGQVVDCRVCGDPNSVLRFAFIEFTDEDSAKNALTLSGTVLGFYPVRVLPSKTAIAPVNPTFLPRSEDEREMCARTVYCTNIDKKITQADLKVFFEATCGEVYRLRMLGDFQHSTRIAFVEFVMAESAIFALNCSGAFLGALPIRVSPSKTPVRPRPPRSP